MPTQICKHKGRRSGSYPPCCLCELLEDWLGNAHTRLLDFYFANPLSCKCIPKVAWNHMKELKELGVKKELPEWTAPLLEAAGKMEDPTQSAETAAGKEMQVSKEDT